MKNELTSKRSLEEAASIPQEEFFGKRAVYRSVEDDIKSLREKLTVAEASREALEKLVAQMAKVKLIRHRALPNEARDAWP